MTSSKTIETLASKAEAKEFLLKIKERIADKTISPVHVLSSMKWLLAQENIYEYLDSANKEIAREVWLKVRQAGVHVKNPPMLFSAEEEDLISL